MNVSNQYVFERYRFDRTRLMDILWDIQRRDGFISVNNIEDIALNLKLSPNDVKETLSFYHFFLDKPFGKHHIYLSNTVIAKMNGYYDVKKALESETHCKFNSVDKTQTFGLAETNCIGLSDQEPAMMVDDVVFTQLTPAKVKSIIAQLKQGKSAEEIANPKKYASNTLEYVNAIVDSNIKTTSQVLFKPDRDYKKLLTTLLTTNIPEEVIETIIESNLRGRGGAGFPTGLKWKLGREAESKDKYIICNADEGEPGTFKDRVLLTESPKDVLLGMITAAYAIGAQHGIIYLRAEYWYLKAYLEQQIQDFRDNNLLGKQILSTPFDFDIRIQMGAGAYVCGDETALI